MYAFNNLPNVELLVVEKIIEKRLRGLLEDSDSPLDANMVESSGYERAVNAIGIVLVKLGQRLQDKYAHSSPVYQPKQVGGSHPHSA